MQYISAMSRSVICISHEPGAGGRELASAVAEHLDYRYVDEEVVRRAAETQKVSIEDLVDVERRKSFFTRLMVDFGRSSPALYAAGAPTTLTDGLPSADQLRSAIRNAIDSIASEGRVVIVSHAASHALNGDDVLRVLVVAPEDARTTRIAEVADLDHKAAGKRRADEDAGRRDYLKRFYDIERESAAQYDLVVNTGRIAPSAFVPLVAAAAQL